MSAEELLVGLLVPSGWFLWWATGRGLLRTKAWRRWLWPLLCAWASLWTGHTLGQAIVGFAAMAAAHHLGYWDDDPIWKTLIAAASIGLCVMAFGAAWWWAVVIAAWFLGASIWSQRTNRLWVLVEGATGGWQGLAIALGLTRIG